MCMCCHTGVAHQSKPVLVGHGVGTWISVLVASQRPDLIHGIVGMYVVVVSDCCIYIYMHSIAAVERV